VRVALIDRGDFAGVTSQESSNLAWGGIKYMEGYEFGLVRKLCLARREHVAPEVTASLDLNEGCAHGAPPLVVSA